MDRPKVSVSLITYNHERYIAEAIESVLMQRTNFPYELIIGEDESQDRTREIVKEYGARYPDRIRLHLHSRSTNISYGGRPTGRHNFVNNLRSARGEYIALLDGDDYWIAPDKLQQQVDLLDSRPECSTCFHPVTRIDEGGRALSDALDVSDVKQTYTVYELLDRKFFANTASVLFRRGLFGEFPDWYFEAPVGDFPLHVLNGLSGDFAFIEKSMAAYRIHGASIWSATSAPGVAPKPTEKSLKQILGVVHLYEILLENLDPKYAPTTRDALGFYRLQAAHRLRHLKDWTGLRELTSSMLRDRTFPRDGSFIEAAALVVQAHLPWTATLTDKLREFVLRGSA